MMIREEQAADFPVIDELNRLAFGEGGEGALVRAIRAGDAPFLSLVAESEAGVVIAHLLFSVISIEEALESLRALGLGPMAVHPRHQRQGVGTALLERILFKFT